MKMGLLLAFAAIPYITPCYSMERDELEFANTNQRTFLKERLLPAYRKFLATHGHALNVDFLSPFVQILGQITTLLKNNQPIPLSLIARFERLILLDIPIAQQNNDEFHQLKKLLGDNQ